MTGSHALTSLTLSRPFGSATDRAFQLDWLFWDHFSAILVAMQFLVEFLSGLIALLAAAALSQFGVDLDMPRPADREIERTQTCPPAPSSTVKVKAPAAC